MSAIDRLCELLEKQIALQTQLSLDQSKQLKFKDEQLLSQLDNITVKITEKEERNKGSTAVPKFTHFDPMVELWKDYWSRFLTYVAAYSLSTDRIAKVFLTNQTTTIYRLLTNLSSQMNPPKDINDLSIDEITIFMRQEFDPKTFTVRERHKFWTNCNRKPGETINELASRIRQDAATCDFTGIKDPLDEAMRTRFVCSLNNEATLKSLFRIPEDELTFSKAIQIALEAEGAATVAKDTIYGDTTKVLYMNKKNHQNLQKKLTNDKMNCLRCGSKEHKSSECTHKDVICRYCNIMGHMEKVCLKKRRKFKKVNCVRSAVTSIKRVSQLPPIHQDLILSGDIVSFELDTGASDNFISLQDWRKIGSPKLSKVSTRHVSATGDTVQTIGQFTATTQLRDDPTLQKREITYFVSRLPLLNLLGRTAIKNLGISIDQMMSSSDVKSIQNSQMEPYTFGRLKTSCESLCSEFPEVFSNQLGCLKDFELDIKFKQNEKPVFKRPRVVPFAILDDLNQSIDSGIQKGIWEWTTFNDYGTPVVPVRKKNSHGSITSRLRICGDYSATINDQLDTMRYPIPTAEELIQKLGGSYCFSKIDLADAYNQIRLSKDSQKKLALSTHRGVLLQKRLPFGIASAPGYFQKIMNGITNDLEGVAVYFDDILVGGVSESDHLTKLRSLFKRLEEKGLCCNKDKCDFAKSSIEYLGHTITQFGVKKGMKCSALLEMPEPKSVQHVKSFLGAIQFYSKFLPNLSTLADPLYRLMEKDAVWKWTNNEKQAFKSLKQLLCEDTLLVHFNPNTCIGISSDASDTGIGAVLFHRYEDGSEKPISYISKTLSKAQRKYSQIHKEALAIVYALNKFHQYVYGRKFVLVTDHKPLLSIFASNREVPRMAANRLARWALVLSQYEYQIEYRKTSEHGNADILSRLPIGGDIQFDQSEDEFDQDTVLSIKTIDAVQLTTDKKLQNESRKDVLISSVIRYISTSWPNTTNTPELKALKKISEFLSHERGCLFYGNRVVIPRSMIQDVLQTLHIGHFGAQKMKNLARTAVYWPGIDNDIEQLSRTCLNCATHRKSPPKAEIHPWILPEKPWSRIHIDHAINFLGTNWLVMIDAYSKYPCINQSSSCSTKSTTDILDMEFAHFGFPHTIVTDNGTSFTSEEFKRWCKERRITHLTGAPYHPATNGAAERLIQSFKNSMKKTKGNIKEALYNFLMQYRRTPLGCGYSPSELLIGRQIRTKIDILSPCVPQICQGYENKNINLSRKPHKGKTLKKNREFKPKDPCYAINYKSSSDTNTRWVPATILKRYGARNYSVQVHPVGPIWKRHIDQLQPRYQTLEDDEPGVEIHGDKPEEIEKENISTAEQSEIQALNKQAEEIGTTQVCHELPRRSHRSNKSKPPERYSPGPWRTKSKKGGVKDIDS